MQDLLLGSLGVDMVVFAVPGSQLRTPLPTDCFTQIGVRGPAQGDSSPGGTLRPSGGWRRRPRRVGRMREVRRCWYDSMGNDVKQLQLRKKEADVAEWVQVLEQRYEGLKIVVGRGKLHEVQGVHHKILEFEAFLAKFIEWMGKVRLIRVALQRTESNELAGGGVEDYQLTQGSGHCRISLYFFFAYLGFEGGMVFSRGLEFCFGPRG